MSYGAVALLTVSIVKLVQRSLRLDIQVLKPAAICSLLVVANWLLACLMTLGLFEVSSAALDQLWYWTAVFSCCPLISILGAKRPTSNVWTWFIILPLIAVLGWPAVTVLSRFPVLTPLEIQLPVYIGFVLVLVMGIGNYLGSRFALSVLLCGLAVLISMWPFSNLFEGNSSTADAWRTAAALLFGFGLLHGLRQADRPTAEESPFDKLWFDFCDVFGIVWSMRIQDRINQTAEQENWAVRLGPSGFVWQGDVSDEERTRALVRLEQTLRWLLRRFVEPEWITNRLQQTSQPGQTEHAEVVNIQNA